MGLGYSRKELGKLHQEYYNTRFENSTDDQAFQRAVMSMVRGMLDLIDANNRKLEQDIKELLQNSSESR